MVHSTRRFNELTLEKLAEMKEEGKTEQEISKFFGLTVTTFRLIKAKMLDTLELFRLIFTSVCEKGEYLVRRLLKLLEFLNPR